MSTKNYGPLVSGYLDPDGRAWETTVFQAGKPVLDKELNLQEDIATDTRRVTRVPTSPSGWLNTEWLESTDPAQGLFVASAAPNLLALSGLTALVNGWRVEVTHTDFAGLNLFDMGTGPLGAAAKREDLIILEVWRRLIPPAPATTGKSPAGRIWKNGNVKIPVGDDLTANFADDILDGMVGSETTKRVQIQYRLRVIPGVDLFGYPYGIDDPAVVFANTVPASALLPNGVATAFNYVNQEANRDQGLWRAGDGNPANGLGTVDGYMYAIPLCAVVRRNTTAFDRNTNHNGGVASPGPSDRPDGLFYDVIVERDLIDLRMCVSPDGWNFQELLEKGFNTLLDNGVRTEIGSTAPVGGGVNGHTVLVADDIGISNANGGDGVVTGDTPGANLIGQFDAVLRRYSDRPQVELAVLVYSPAGPSWVNNEIVTVSPSALPVYQEGGAFNFAAYAPADMTFVDLAGAFFMGSGGASPTVGITPQSVSNLGQVPQGALSVDIGTVPAGITNEPLILYFSIAYPSGLGLTKTPTDSFPDSLYFNNPLQLPAAAPVLYEDVDGFGFDYPHREVTLTYRTVSHTLTLAPASTNLVLMPERVLSISGITINAVPYFGPAVVSSTGYVIDFSPTVLAATDAIAITFKSLRPFPQNDEQVTVYYEARMPQTTRDALLGGATLLALPRHVSTDLHTLTVGSGSEDEAYPFPFQYVQAGGVYPGSGGVFAGDHELDGRSLITVSDFDAETGWLRLPTFVGYVPAGDEAKFNRTPGDVDAEGRSYYKEAAFGLYVPNAFSQELSDPKRHKVLLPVLAELTATTPWGYPGQLFLLMLSRWALFDEDNSVIFDSNLLNNTTTASVYRLKGNPLNRRPI